LKACFKKRFKKESKGQKSRVEEVIVESHPVDEVAEEAVGEETVEARISTLII
jgi:hypothetical protein